MLITINVQLVLLGEGTDFIFLYRGQNTISSQITIQLLVPNLYIEKNDICLPDW